MPQPQTVDVVVPLYNEADACRAFHSQLQHAIAELHYAFRFIYVDDGSCDGTATVLQQIAAEDPRVAVLHLSRNFGHQAALTAGLDHAGADAVIMMDGDGQHPPALIREMLRLYECGYDVVQTQRVDPASTGFLKRLTAAGFYGLLNRLGELKIGSGVADFRLISRDVLKALQGMREYHRFVRGIVPWLGFRTVAIAYTASARIGGKSKFTLAKMLHLARDGMFSFSLYPLRIGITIGITLLLLAFAEVCYILSFFIRGNQHLLVPGWSSVIILLTLTSGTTMILLGFIGVYVGMIFQQVKGRPIYVIRSEPRTRVGPEWAETTAQNCFHETN